MTDRHQLERAIAAQEELRGTLPDDVVDTAVAALRAQLDAIDDAVERRRQVTVLFADVHGFTSMSETRDPEVVTGVMNALWERLDAVIVAGGGAIDKHIGDAVMAVWGADASGEDDPECAVRTALALQAALVEFRGETGHELAMRAGVNTGLVHVAPFGTTGEVTVVGDAVNLASRLEGAAPVGGVLISHDTYRHVRGVFDVEVLDPIRVKGKRDAVQVYVVHRAKPRAFRIATRGVEGVETRTVGREDELEGLRGLFHEVVSCREPRIVTVLGEAGVGKSRLLYELENWVELRSDPVYLFKGRALSTRQAVPYGLFRDVLANRFGILDSDASATVAEKLRGGTAGRLEPNEAEVLGHWLGFELAASNAVQQLTGSPEFATLGRAHLLRLLQSFEADDPVAVLLEDLHWADEESLDLADDLGAHLHGRFFVVGAARPSLLERRPDWPQAGRLELGALTPEATRRLAREVLQRVPDIPHVLVDLVVARADGNAFYVEELVKMLVDEEVIHTGDSGAAWRVDLDRLDEERVPATLMAVLQARLDGLDERERGVLQRASVIGRVFWDAAVASLGADGAEGEAPAVAASLDAARRREFVYPREHSSFAAAQEFIFKHALLRDVTYDTVLLRDRPGLHRAAAGWLEASCGDRLSEYLEMIAEHYERSGDPLTAAERLVRAATAERAKGIWFSVRRSLERAVELTLAGGGKVAPETWGTLGEACWRLGDLAAAQRALSTAIDGADDPVVAADALYYMACIEMTRGDQDAERAWLDRALALAEGSSGETLATILTGLAWWESQHGDLRTAQAFGTRALEVARTARSAVAQSKACSALPMVATLSDDLDLAEQELERAAELAVRSGNLELEAQTRGNMGLLAHLRADASKSDDDYRVAARRYGEARVLAHRLGLPVLEATQVMNLAQVSVRLGDDDAARQYLRAALTIIRGVGSTDQELFAVIAEADRRASFGDVDEGLALLGLVRSHPAVSTLFLQEIERVVARLGLDTVRVEAGMAAGAGRSLADEIAAILATPGRENDPS
jgi:class 3 adenylate cyclase/tetratricopeptide (TPR) repeat protein